MDRKELETLIRTLVERYLAREPLHADTSPHAEPCVKVVTELEVREAGLGGIVPATADAIVTAAADDLARAWGVRIQRGCPTLKTPRCVAVGADHAGYETKEDLKQFLATLEGVEVLDLGTHSKETVDYPDFAHAVAEAVASGKAEVGILADGAGIGSAIAANKVPGVRAAMCYDAVTARNSREHNFANVLTLGARLLDTGRAREIVKVFLETRTGAERHAARVRKIVALEKKYMKLP